MLDIPTSIGRYEILERVARGGMGALYRARDPVLEREVAIKVMLADFSHDANGRTRFYREARAIARLQHRNIVTLFDYGEDEGNPFIVMEFLQGQTLAARVKHGPPVPLAQALATGAQLCTGLHFAHGSGIVHRDVKPANIWLEDDGGVKLLDFGIAKFGDTDVTQAGDVLGSISYMSPEQLAGGTIDGRSDIFSAGIVMYELLSGRRPFQGESPTAIMMKIIHEEAPPLDEVPGAPPKLRGMIAKALEKNPERRYQRAAEFASDLRDLQITIERQQESIRAAQTDTVPEHPAGPAASAPATPAAKSPGSSRPGRVTAGCSFAGSPTSEAITRWWRGSRRDAQLRGDGHGHAHARTAGVAGARGGGGVDRPGRVVDAVRRRDRRLGRSAERRDDWRPRGFRHRWRARESRADRLAARVGARERRRGDHRGGRRRLLRDARRSDGSHWRRAGVRCRRRRVVFVGREPVGIKTDGRFGEQTIGQFGALPGHRQGWRSAVLVGIAASPSSAIPGGGTGAVANGANGAPGAGAGAGVGAGAGAPATSPASTASPSAASSVHVMLSGSYPFEVSGDGGVLSRARSRHELNLAGPQTLRLRAPEYGLDRRVEVNAKPGETVRLSAPALGRLTVRTTFETCQIFLGGLALGYPPIAERPIASGTYRLTLRCPDGDQSDTNGDHPGGCHLHGADPMTGRERRGRPTPRAAVAVSVASSADRARHHHPDGRSARAAATARSSRGVSMRAASRSCATDGIRRR